MILVDILLVNSCHGNCSCNTQMGYSCNEISWNVTDAWWNVRCDIYRWWKDCNQFYTCWWLGKNNKNSRLWISLFFILFLFYSLLISFIITWVIKHWWFKLYHLCGNISAYISVIELSVLSRLQRHEQHIISESLNEHIQQFISDSLAW